MSRDKLIKQCFEDDYSYAEIREILIDSGKNISYRHLQRVIKSLGLSKKNKSENLDHIIYCILQELEGSGNCLGYKALWLRLKQTYKLEVKRDTVLNVLRVVDPEGIEERSRYRLKRRQYKVPGPNFIWHIDGYDKLKFVGLAIHACIDGFSRKVLWLEVGVTNNKPEVIAYYYLKTVKKLKKIPTLIRSDNGSENTVIDGIHQAFRSQHDDEYSGVNSFKKGKSTANQRIESFWGRMRKHCVQFWITFFKDMIEENHFDKSNAIQVECLRFCFAPLIQYELELTRKEWNQHSIRKQKTGNIISGKPNFLYYIPKACGAEDCSKTIDEDHIDNAFKNFAKNSTYCNPVFVKLVEEILPSVSVPQNVEEATILYHKILVEVDKC